MCVNMTSILILFAYKYLVKLNNRNSIYENSELFNDLCMCNIDDFCFKTINYAFYP